jgi:copper chaperone NosL
MGCGGSEIRPVDIFPEDNCAQCRMVISDERCASEIIDERGDVFKFDDISCLLNYRSKHSDIRIIATFLKDYESKQWMPYENASIVETGAETPMGSGKIAFADSKQALAFQKQHPRITSTGKPDKCCE